MASSAAAELSRPTIRAVYHGMNWTRIHHDPLPTRVYPSPSIARIIPHESPSWSVFSLLPSPNDIEAASSEITRDKLHHLLRLSALPSPKTQHEENKMLQTLRSQVHFVKQVQSVDTTGVEPLVCIRDETSEAIEEDTIKLEKMKPWLAREDVDRNGTVRLRRSQAFGNSGFDAFQLGVGSHEKSGRKEGRYFVVKTRGRRKHLKEPAAEKSSHASAETSVK